MTLPSTSSCRTNVANHTSRVGSPARTAKPLGHAQPQATPQTGGSAICDHPGPIKADHPAATGLSVSADPHNLRSNAAGHQASGKPSGSAIHPVSGKLSGYSISHALRGHRRPATHRSKDRRRAAQRVPVHTCGLRCRREHATISDRRCHPSRLNPSIQSFQAASPTYPRSHPRLTPRPLLSHKLSHQHRRTDLFKGSSSASRDHSNKLRPSSTTPERPPSSSTGTPPPRVGSKTRSLAVWPDPDKAKSGTLPPKRTRTASLTTSFSRQTASRRAPDNSHVSFSTSTWQTTFTTASRTCTTSDTPTQSLS